MGWSCSTNGWKRNAYRLLVGKPEGKRPLGRPRSRWVDNIRMDLGEVGWPFKLEAMCSSETFVKCQRTIRCYMPFIATGVRITKPIFIINFCRKR
jgi:hypothetical protein